MKPDIRTKEDIVLLIDTFYSKAKSDTEIGHFFTDVIQLSWEEHLPIMYTFWSSILLNEGQYQGRLMRKHILLDQKSRITPEHLKRWQQFFYETLDELYEGEIADEAKRRVQLMGELMMFKINKARDPHFLQ